MSEKRRVLKTKLLLQKRKLYLTYGMLLCLVTLTDGLNVSRGFCQHQLSFLFCLDLVTWSSGYLS